MFGRKKPPVPAANYEKLGRQLESVLIADYIDLLGNTRKQVWGSFVRGIFAGLGGVIGATVIVALLLYILHLAGGAPLVGRWLTNVANNIHTVK